MSSTTTSQTTWPRAGSRSIRSSRIGSRSATPRMRTSWSSITPSAPSAWSWTGPARNGSSGRLQTWAGVVFAGWTGHNPGMTVVLTGHDLTPAEVIDVARHGAAVSIDPGALVRMSAARAVVERALERGDEIYGLT